MKLQQSTLIATWDILVVDADPAFHNLTRIAAQPSASRVRTATSTDQALAQMKLQAADLVFINLQVNDSAGIPLIKTLRAKYPNTQFIATSRAKRSDLCLDAFRAGAADLLFAPFQEQDLQRSLLTVLNKTATASPAISTDELIKRNRRLRSVCKQLNKARHEIRQQVDLLCNDLVRAYQAMAQQLNATQLAVDYCNLTANEIEVEGLLRKTMEWILAKVGPVNAAVYLSDANRNFALGAYLNLDTDADSELIAALAETLIKKSANSQKTLALESDSELANQFGQAADPLRNKSWLATACFAPSPKHECLAVLALFRKPGESLDPARTMIEAIAPILGEKIEQALELYHRMHPREEEDSDSEYNYDPDQED